MAPRRQLPERQNPLIQPEHTPQREVEILIERRRLGSTNLAVKPGQVGLGNASKPENLGIFDYAHLRVPLPKDLKGSGIFSLQEKSTYPESYFLMRRSSDGYISATGMFKAAYPWASLEEEESERQHHKSLPTGDGEEVAGNVWIAPEPALKLAEEYGMRPWIVALLDPEPIEKGTRDKEKTQIATPPKFIVPDKGALLPPASAVGSMRTRGRELRSASPSKIATPSRKMASPRKPRTTRKSAKTETTDTAAGALHNVVENGVKPASEPTESIATESVAPSVDGETVHVEVDEVVEKSGDVETTTTTVKIEMPSDHPELPIPESAEDMVAQAREMVERVKEKEGEQPNGVKALKRKAEEIEEDEGDKQEVVQPAKKTKLEDALKKERIKTKSLIGLGAVIAAGAALQYLL